MKLIAVGTLARGHNYKRGDYTGEWHSYRGFITSCKEDLGVKHHLAVTNVSSHWYLFIQWSMIKVLMHSCATLYGLRSTVYALPLQEEIKPLYTHQCCTHIHKQLTPDMCACHNWAHIAISP